MHTATYPKRDSLRVNRAKRPIGVEDVFPDWNAADRFGVVVDGPCSVIGASLLVQVAALLFYETLPARSSSLKRYPEIYAFLLDGPKGDLGMLDFYPTRKEVVVPRDPTAMLDAILDRGITRLAVIDAPGTEHRYGWDERNTAHECFRTVYAYDPSGRARDADLFITGTDRTEINVTMTLWPDQLIDMITGWTEDEIREFEPQLLDADFGFDAEAYTEYARRREGEISQRDRRRLAEQRAALLQQGGPTESYRTVPVDEALKLLVPASAALAVA